MRVLTANIAGRRAVPQLRAAIARRRPAVVVVTEAYRARAWLLTIPGYRLYQYTRRQGREAPGIAVLVDRRRVRVARRRPMRMRQPWTGPGGRRKAPRTFPVFVLDLGGELLPFLPVHFPSGGPHGPNAAAWWESWRRVSRWLARHPRAVAAGDWNALQGELADILLAGLQLLPGTKVDHAITVGVDHRRTERIRPIPAGMHGWLVYTLRGRVA